MSVCDPGARCVSAKQDNRASPGVSPCTTTRVHSDAPMSAGVPGPRKGKCLHCNWTSPLPGEPKHRSSISQHPHRKIVRKPMFLIVLMVSLIFPHICQMSLGPWYKCRLPFRQRYSRSSIGLKRSPVYGITQTSAEQLKCSQLGLEYSGRPPSSQ